MHRKLDSSYCTYKFVANAEGIQLSLIRNGEALSLAEYHLEFLCFQLLRLLKHKPCLVIQIIIHSMT